MELQKKMKIKTYLVDMDSNVLELQSCKMTTIKSLDDHFIPIFLEWLNFSSPGISQGLFGEGEEVVRLKLSPVTAHVMMGKEGRTHGFNKYLMSIIRYLS